MKRKHKKRHPSSPQGSRIRSAVLILFFFAAGYAIATFIQTAPFKKIPVRRPAPPAKIAGRIAIIIDDNGYNDDACRFIPKIPQPVTVAILPNLAYSRAVDACSRAQRKEIMLHLPMEPHVSTETYPKDYVIKTDMSPGKMREIFHESLMSVPHADGVNNHMGSKATEDARTMTVLFDQLQRNGLFFVDSRVTKRTIAPDLAAKMGVRFAQRDVFLDNQKNRSAIERQFAELAQKARRQGFAIGIGHSRPLTWDIVREQAARLEREGFRIVTVKELIAAGEGTP